MLVVLILNDNSMLNITSKGFHPLESYGMDEMQVLDLVKFMQTFKSK